MRIIYVNVPSLLAESQRSYANANPHSPYKGAPKASTVTLAGKVVEYTRSFDVDTQSGQQAYNDFMERIKPRLYTTHIQELAAV